MFPVICKFGPFTVYSYGLMLAVAVAVCSILLSRDARKAGIPADTIFDLVFWVMLSGLLGARLFFILTNWDLFAQEPLEMIKIQNGGLSWQGGLILGSLAGMGYVKRKRLPLLQMLDLSAPYLALGQAIGRIGCFLNGCC